MRTTTSKCSARQVIPQPAVVLLKSDQHKAADNNSAFTVVLQMT